MLAQIGNYITGLWNFESSAQMPSTSAGPDLEAQAKKFEERKLTDRVYQLTPDPGQETQQTHVEIVLFHGLQMPGSNPAHAHWRTWKMRKSEDCWLETLLPKLFVRDGGRQYRARVLSVSYEGRADMGDHGKTLGTADSDAHNLVESLIKELIIGGTVNLGQNVPVLLVGHDLGGILIKLLVIEVEKAAAVDEGTLHQKKLRKFLDNLKSVFFYATPHSGSPVLDQLAERIPKNTRNEMLHFMKVLNAKKSRVNQDFQSYRRGHASLGLSRFSTSAIHASHKTYLEELGGFVMVVPEGTERLDVDHFFTSNADHFQVCQPEGISTSSAQMLRDEIEKVSKEQEESEKKVVSSADREQTPPPEEVRAKREAFMSRLGHSEVVVCTSGNQASARPKIRG